MEQVQGRPNLASTIWLSVADLKHAIYYFENTDRPNIFWVDVSKLQLEAGMAVKKLNLTHNEIYAGDVSQQFVASAPFFQTATLTSERSAPKY